MKHLFVQGIQKYTQQFMYNFCIQKISVENKVLSFNRTLILSYKLQISLIIIDTHYA